MSTENVVIQVQEDGSRAVVSSLNQTADATDKVASSQEAMQKVMKGVETSMRQLVDAVSKLNSQFNQQASSTQRVVQAQSQATASTNALTQATAQQAETEEQATARIHAMVAASVQQAEAQRTAAAAASEAATAQRAAASSTGAAASAQQAATAAYNASAGAYVRNAMEVEALDQATNGHIKTMDEWRDVEGRLVDAQQRGVVSGQQYNRMLKQLDSQLPGLNASIKKEESMVASLTARYDPLSAKTQKLAADEKLLQDLRNKGLVSGSAYTKILAGITGQKALVEKGTEEAGKAMKKFGTISGGVAREYGVMVGELARGNYTRLEGSFITLANRAGLLQKVFSGVGLSILGLTALVAGIVFVLYRAEEAFTQLNAAVIKTGQYTGITSGQIQELSQQLSGVGKSTTESTELLEALVNTGRVTQESFTDVGRAAYNAMKLTGDSIDGVASSFSRLYDDPLKWADDMDKQFHTLTADVRDHIQALQDTGDKYGAAELAAKSFADNTDARVKELTENMGYLQKAVKGVTDYLGYVKDFWLSIGAPKTAMQKQVAQFQQLKQSYLDTIALGKQMGWTNSSNPNHDRFMAGLQKQWENLNKLGTEINGKAASDKAAAAAQAQVQHQQDLAKDADKFLDGVNDKTQKQITLQNKLNQLTQSYANLINFRPNDPRLKGVSMDNQGNIHGGSFDTKKEELIKQYTPKVSDRAAKEAAKAAEKYQQSLKQLQETIDPTQAAMDKLTAAQKLLNTAVAKGDMTQNDADFAFAMYQAQLQDTINPLEALHKKLQDQIDALKSVGKATDAHNKAQADANTLLKEGVVLNEAQKKSLEDQYTAIDTLTAKQQVYDRIQKSIINHTKQYVDELAVLQQMEAKGTITPKQADQYLVQQSPDLFKGTQKQLNVQIQQYKDYYKQIESMRKLNLISAQDASVMEMNVNQQIMNARLGQTETFLGQLMQMKGSHSRKAAGIAKAAAIAETIINTYKSATEAFSSLASIPYVGPILGAAAAAAAVAAGMANIQQIRSTNYQGGYRTGGEFIVGGNGGTDSQRVSFDATPGERVMINTPEQARALARADAIMSRGRQTNVTQNLTIAVQGRVDRRTQSQIARAQRRAVKKEYERSNG